MRDQQCASASAPNSKHDIHPLYSCPTRVFYSDDESDVMFTIRRTGAGTLMIMRDQHIGEIPGGEMNLQLSCCRESSMTWNSGVEGKNCYPGKGAEERITGPGLA